MKEECPLYCWALLFLFSEPRQVGTPLLVDQTGCKEKERHIFVPLFLVI